MDYEPNRKCPACQAVGKLCVGCATTWKLRLVDVELKVLRKIAVLSRRCLNGRGGTSGIKKLNHALERWEIVKSLKPRALQRSHQDGTTATN